MPQLRAGIPSATCLWAQLAWKVLSARGVGTRQLRRRKDSSEQASSRWPLRKITRLAPIELPVQTVVPSPAVELQGQAAHACLAGLGAVVKQQAQPLYFRQQPSDRWSQ